MDPKKLVVHQIVLKFNEARQEIVDLKEQLTKKSFEISRLNDIIAEQHASYEKLKQMLDAKQKKKEVLIATDTKE